jgi:hypothetical protein
MPTIDDRIAAAEKRLRQLKTQREQIEARQLARVLKGQRADDTRRKILTGAVVLSAVEHGEAGWSRETLMALLSARLTRADDRALFGLPAQ